MSALIKIENLNKSYGKQPVLKDINLTVQPGQILGLVGPNGAGKTTCLQALLGLLQYSGNIQVMQHDPSQKRHLMLNDVAYIADVAVLPMWLKVNQAIDYMANVHPNFNRDQALTFLAKTNIGLDKRVKALSKGMVTQLHLALILAVDAKVLVLDEPTLGLDIFTRRQFYNHLLEDFYDESKCIIVTTHQIEEIENILTDVAFIQNGEIVLHESVDHIRNRFKILAVANQEMEQAKSLKPLFSNSMMGITTMLFDNADEQSLEALGNLTSPSLADVFVGIMSREELA